MKIFKYNKSFLNHILKCEIVVFKYIGLFENLKVGANLIRDELILKIHSRGAEFNRKL